MTRIKVIVTQHIATLSKQTVSFVSLTEKYT